jgi:CRISPR-associated endonuclease/helicase Cas3
MTATSPVPYPELWAKTGTDPNGATYGYPLYNHLDDTASIAEAVIDRWLGPKGSSPYTRLSKALGIAPEKALTFACLAHDIGKADPHFQAKVEELARNNPWYKPPVGPGAPHNIVSAQATQAFLDTYGATRGAKRGWATVLAGHHGMFPASADRPLKTNDYETWSNVRLTLLSHLCELHGIAESDIETMGLIEWRAGDITLMTSLLITCDWLASNEDAFPITAGPSVATGRERAREARHKLALGPAWAPAQQPLDKWQHRFGLEASARLHDSQQDVLDAARRMDASGGMLLIESATGSGKSAAALIAADIIAAKTKARGIIYAQPSQATANSALPTVASWVAKHPTGAPVGAALAHGKAELVQDAHDVYRLSDGAISTHQWSVGRLAPFAPVTISTIDQVLQAVLKARYAVLRQAAIVGKVIVLDEVHSSDTHMSVYLDRLLEYAGYWGTSVIAMSATLSDTRRKELVSAYESGRNKGEAPKHKAAPQRVSNNEHARVTAVRSSGTFTLVRRQKEGTVIDISFGPHAEQDIAESVVNEAIHCPSCIGVVLDTVGRSQRVFDAISTGAPTGTEVVLLHSRFTALDRRAIESRVTESLGRNGTRPESLIVVATQVVEQALDLDFDMLYTDIAPADMLVQRMGRLHRHDRQRPTARRNAQVVITGVDFEFARPAFASGIDTVYDAATLYETLAVIQNKQCISRPQDVPSLMREVFDERAVFPAAWGEMTDVLDARARAQDETRANAETAVLPPPYNKGWWKDIETVLGSSEHTPGVRAGFRTTEVCLLARRGSEVVPISADDTEPHSAAAIAASSVAVPSFIIEQAKNEPACAKPDWWPKRGPSSWAVPVTLDGRQAVLGDWVISYDSIAGVRVRLEKQRDG